MCRSSILLALCLTGLVPALRAQEREDADARGRRLLARAESLYARQRERRANAASLEREARRATLMRAGDLDVIAPSFARSDSLRAGLDTAAALLDEFGAVPRPFLRALVLVSAEAEDTAAALGAASLGGRRRVAVSATLRREPAWVGWWVALAVLRAYRATLDAEWQAWLPTEYGLRRAAPRGESLSWRAFNPTTAAAGAGCLAGDPARCRRWLGLDRDSDPYAERFRPAELRSFFELDWSSRNDVRARPCLRGNDAACLAYARETGRPPVVPASDDARRSLLRAVHVLHGAGALAAALADTGGPVGERLARAAGIGEDSLVLEWRHWALGQEHPGSSRSGGKEAAPALLFAGLLLFAASRSGRWR